MGWPEWNGNDIAVLSIHRPRSVPRRLDVFPFLILYASIAAYFVRSMPSQFTASLICVTAVLLHILVFLVQHWSLAARVGIGYWRVTSIGGKDEDMIKSGKIRVRAVPPPYKGKAEFEKLECDGKRIHFSFQRRVYEYNRETGKFEMVLYPEHMELNDYTMAARKFGGLNDESIYNNLIRYGPNRLEIPLPQFWTLYKDQLLSPFFVFQVFCNVLWVLEAYWLYFAMTLGMMLIFEATVVKGRLRSLTELRGMRNRPLKVHAYRNEKWVSLNSMELLPGDIISLTRNANADTVAPCDCLIISGGAVVNEAMLTGESVPLMKEGIAPLSEKDGKQPLEVMSKDKGHIIFGGTRILTHTPAAISDATPPSKAPDNGCVCFVLRTGFGSSQGLLLRTILTSTEKVSANSWEAAMFIVFLLIFALLASGYVLVKGLEDESRSKYKLMLHCVMIITSVIPPELPMQLALAVNSSLIALAKNFVFCTEPFRIPFAGKVDVCCFDKTGTLTTDNIKAVGVALLTDEDENTTRDQLTKVVDNREYPLVQPSEASFDAACVLAGCHSLVYVDNELTGDPLELAALDSVAWTFTKSDAAVPKKGGGQGIKILHRNRFISKLQRMSTIVQVQQAGGSSPPRALVKGSAEAVGKLLAGEKPEKYDATAIGLARRGLRVLALAYKTLDESLTPSGLKAYSREEVESDLTFVGFIAFECPLRDDSKKTVKHLRSSSHRVVMITGDAVLTAVHVAKEVGICMKRKHTYILDQGKEGFGWISASTGQRKFEFDLNKVSELGVESDLAISGQLLDSPSLTEEMFKALLPHIKIYARMAPEQKELVLTGYKDQGLITLMCGDGTNDVGALKQADVGVALLSFTAPTEPALKAPPSAAMLRMQKRGEAFGAADNLGKKKPTTEKKTGTKKTASSSKDVKEVDTEASKGGSISREAASNMSPEERRKREVKEELEKKIQQLKQMEQMMDDDEPKLVKLGDASIASPFTSKKTTIESCAVIIRQGRCTLATTLQMYQILALNCLISAYGLSVLYLDGVKFGDKQMTLSGIVIAAAFFFITRAQPLEQLSSQRPAPSVFHPSLFFSLLAQFAVHLGTLAFVVQVSKDYLPKDFDPDVDGEFVPNILNTMVFLLSTAQQVVVFAVNYKGYPFMQGLRDNRVLRNTLIFNFAFVLILGLEIMPEMNEFAQLSPMPEESLRYFITKWIIVDAVGSLAVDRFFSILFRPRIRNT